MKRCTIFKDFWFANPVASDLWPLVYVMKLSAKIEHVADARSVFLFPRLRMA